MAYIKSKNDEIIYKINEMNEKIDIFNDKLNELSNIVNVLKNYIEINNKTISDLAIASFSDKKELIIKNVKVEKMRIPIDEVKTNLCINTLAGDANIFKIYYINDIPIELVPFKKFVKKYQYWNNGKWHDDVDGSTITNIISKNIVGCYTSINNITNISDSSVFANNQNHIFKVGEENYKKRLFKQVVKYFQIIE